MWCDISAGQYRVERQLLQRQLRELPTGSGTSVLLPDMRRAGELLQDFGRLWDHPGVSDETRKQFIQEAFEQVQVDEVGIRAVRFAEAFLPAVAVGVVGGNGAGDEVRTRDILLGRKLVGVINGEGVSNWLPLLTSLRALVSWYVMHDLAIQHRDMVVPREAAAPKSNCNAAGRP